MVVAAVGGVTRFTAMSRLGNGLLWIGATGVGLGGASRAASGMAVTQGKTAVGAPSHTTIALQYAISAAHRPSAVSPCIYAVASARIFVGAGVPQLA